MVLPPRDEKLVVYSAVPSTNWAVSTIWPSTKNWTSPIATLEFFATPATVAVNVTGSPTPAGLSELVRLVTVAGGWYSYAPMSSRPLITRLNPPPRWSVLGGGVKNPLPLSIAGLPVNSASVWVGPPLFCSAPRSGSWPKMLLVPLTVAPLVLWTRQKSASTSPLMSLAVLPVVFILLPATMVLSIWTLPAIR